MTHDLWDKETFLETLKGTTEKPTAASSMSQESKKESEADSFSVWSSYDTKKIPLTSSEELPNSCTIADKEYDEIPGEEELKRQCAEDTYKQLFLPSEHAKLRIKNYLISQNIEGSTKEPEDSNIQYFKYEALYYPLIEEKHCSSVYQILCEMQNLNPFQHYFAGKPIISDTLANTIKIEKIFRKIPPDYWLIRTIEDKDLIFVASLLSTGTLDMRDIISMDATSSGHCFFILAHFGRCFFIFVLFGHYFFILALFGHPYREVYFRYFTANIATL